MRCKKCGLEKPETDFYKDKSGYIRKTCKQCTIQQSRENQIKNKEWRKEYCHNYHLKHKQERMRLDKQFRDMKFNLKKPCLKCGEDRLYVIDFHHINPANKSFNINRKTSKKDFSIIENEIKKCVCLCRNCHSEFHYLYGVKPKDPEKALSEYLKESEDKKL